jgi:hypothetical protein
MRNETGNQRYMRLYSLSLILFSATAAFAHSPDLSSLMFYEQEGERFIVMKSSLTAFEGVVDFHYGKGAYRTPEQFKLLVIGHFKQSCSVLMDGDAMSFVNPQVVLGHETTLFAGLGDASRKITSLAVSNTYFKDMPNSQCEWIVVIGGVPMKQHVLNGSNRYAAAMRVEAGGWVIDEAQAFTLGKAGLLTCIGLMTVAGFLLLMSRKGAED